MDKLTVTRGAVFDYEEIVCLLPFDAARIKSDVEKRLAQCGSAEGPLRLRYHDDATDKDLLFFIRKGYRFGIMQLWIAEGICEEKDYDPAMEEDGRIRKWLEVEIE